MKTLKIGISDYDRMKARTMAIARGEHKPDRGEPTVWFTSIESFAKVLSQRNQGLLEMIAHEKPDSITELAELTGRSKSNLSRTLKTMSRYGLVELFKGERGKVFPRVAYDQVRLDVSLTSRAASFVTIKEGRNDVRKRSYARILGVAQGPVVGSGETEAMDSSAYGQAVIHLAWYRNDKICHLLFGMVELRPSELPRTLGCCMKSARVGNKGKRHVHYERFAVSVSQAIGWYEGVIGGRLVFPDDAQDSESSGNIDLHGGPFVQEPHWPELVASNDLVFAPDWMHGSGAHFLFPKQVVSFEIREALANEKIRNKLEEWLNFDIASAYPDYQGSISLVAPNPLFRTIDKSHIEQSDPDFEESVAYKVVVRAGQRLNGLRLEVVNERLRGRMAPMVHEFDDEAIVQFDFPAEIYKEGQSVTHPVYGLLSWHDPLPLLRKIHVGMEFPRRRKNVRVPAAGRHWPEYEFAVDEVESAGDVTAGDAIDDSGVISRLIEAESRRSRRRAAEEHDQKWFYGVPADAAQYVRSKIGGARKSILIVDPYFFAVGLMAFGHATRRPDVDLRILTSAEGLRESANGESGLDQGSVLQKALDGTFDNISAKPEIRVLPGKSSPIHDRFLVIDDSVWLSGNSLSTLGAKAGMIVRLPDPEPVIGRLEAFWKDSRVLSAWLSDRTAASGKN